MNLPHTKWRRRTVPALEIPDEYQVPHQWRFRRRQLWNDNRLTSPARHADQFLTLFLKTPPEACDPVLDLVSYRSNVVYVGKRLVAFRREDAVEFRAVLTFDVPTSFFESLSTTVAMQPC